MLTRPKTWSGHFCIDEEVLRQAGQSDFSRYANGPEEELMPDSFI